MKRLEIILFIELVTGLGLIVYSINRDWIAFLSMLLGIIFIDFAMTLSKRLGITK